MRKPPVLCKKPEGVCDVSYWWTLGLRAFGLCTLLIAFTVWVWQQAESLRLPVLLAAGGSAALFAARGSAGSAWLGARLARTSGTV